MKTCNFLDLYGITTHGTLNLTRSWKPKKEQKQKKRCRTRQDDGRVLHLEIADIGVAELETLKPGRSFEVRSRSAPPHQSGGCLDFLDFLEKMRFGEIGLQFRVD